MPVYIGVDFHARQQTIRYLTTEDGEIKGLASDHGEPAKVREFYEQFAREKVVVGFESSGYAAWFEELLEELGYEIWIGHTTPIRSFARRRQKNDRRDAELILELLVDGDFPRIYGIPPRVGRCCKSFAIGGGWWRCGAGKKLGSGLEVKLPLLS